MAVTYTTAANVRALISGNTAGLGYLADAIIEAFINRAEDWIDGKTSHAWRERMHSALIQQLGNEWQYSVLEGHGIGLPHRMVRPFRAGVAGTATGGSTTTVIDTVNLTQVDDFWNNYYLTFTSGPNEGQTRKVTDFVAASDTATVDAFPYAVAAGDTFFIGDGVEVWNGAAWQNWILTRTLGRTGDFWLDENKGILFFKTWPFLTGRNAVRVTYRYGESVVPYDVQEAATKLAAIDVVQQEGLRANLAGGGDLNIMTVDKQRDSWQERADAILARYSEWTLIGHR